MKSNKTHPAQKRRARQPTHDEIARTAYQLFEQDGYQHGKDQEHWFNAESMMESNFGYGDSHTESKFAFSEETSAAS